MLYKCAIEKVPDELPFVRRDLDRIGDVRRHRGHHLVDGDRVLVGTRRLLDTLVDPVGQCLRLLCARSRLHAGGRHLVRRDAQIHRRALGISGNDQALPDHPIDAGHVVEPTGGCIAAVAPLTIGDERIEGLGFCSPAVERRIVRRWQWVVPTVVARCIVVVVVSVVVGRSISAAAIAVRVHDFFLDDVPDVEHRRRTPHREPSREQAEHRGITPLACRIIHRVVPSRCGDRRAYGHCWPCEPFTGPGPLRSARTPRAL